MQAALPPAESRRQQAAAGGSSQTAGGPSPYMRVEEPEDTILHTRTYDLYMTYDQYYQVWTDGERSRDNWRDDEWGGDLESLAARSVGADSLDLVACHHA